MKKNQNQILFPPPSISLFFLIMPKKVNQLMKVKINNDFSTKFYFQFENMREKKVVRDNLRYLNMTLPKNVDSKKHYHPIFLFVKIPLRLF